MAGLSVPASCMSEAIIIGAGPAGSMAAILLVRAGFIVTLLEQHAFPRGKVCGECISALGIDVLVGSRLSDSLQRHHPAVFTRAVFHVHGASPVDVPLPRPMWGLTRATLDMTMLHAADEAGVVVHQPARCEQIIPAVRPIVRWRTPGDNRMHTADCDWVIVADGKGALPAHAPPPTRDFGLKTHFAQVRAPRDAIELFGVNGHYGGLAAVEGDCWNAAFTVPVNRLRGCQGNLDVLFSTIADENPALRARLRGAVRVAPWLAAPLPRFPVLEHWPLHVIPIGNAVASLEPVGGEGIGLALRSAELAADALARFRCDQDHAHIDALAPMFESMWRRRSSVWRFVSHLLACPALADAVAPLVAANPSLARAAMICAK